MFPKLFTLQNRQVLIIREARPNDAAAILAYVNKVGAETDFLTFGANEFEISLAEEKAFIQRCQTTPNAVMLLAKLDDQLAGVLIFSGGHRRRIEHRGEFGVSVLKKYWGLGIGTRLVEALIEWAQAGGIVRKINLKVHENNSRAIKLYQKLGFVQEGKITREYLLDGDFYDHLLMGLPLD